MQWWLRNSKGRAKQSRRSRARRKPDSRRSRTLGEAGLSEVGDGLGLLMTDEINTYVCAMVAFCPLSADKLKRI